MPHRADPPTTHACKKHLSRLFQFPYQKLGPRLCQAAIAAGGESHALIDRYRAERCYYGHLHGPTHRRAFEGRRGETDYALVSADYLGFVPKKICD